MEFWRLFQWILERGHDEAYGTIGLTMQKGKIVMVTFEQKTKPEDLVVRDVNAQHKHFAALSR